MKNIKTKPKECEIFLLGYLTHLIFIFVKKY